MEAQKQNRKIAQAFILGAGLGTRLRPVTDTVPKVMVEIAPGKPLLEHTIELLRSQGITDFIVNLHYLPDVIRSHFGDGKRFGVRIRYSDETGGLLETAGALKKAEPMLDDHFLFVYGDQLLFLDTRPLVDLHFSRDALATLLLKTSDKPENGDILEFDREDGKIVRTHPRPHGIVKLTDTRMLNSGIFALSRELLSHIPQGVPVKLDAAIVPALVARGEKIFALPAEEPVLDIGTPEKLAAARAEYRRRKGGKH